MGLNYRDHAREANMPIPEYPVLFVKPRMALNGPFPQKIVVPKVAQDGSSDYEAELTLVISKTGKDIPEKDAMDYVLGYTCGNDVSARTEQFRNSQWSYSKGMEWNTSQGADEAKQLLTSVCRDGLQAWTRLPQLVRCWLLVMPCLIPTTSPSRPSITVA